MKKLLVVLLALISLNLFVGCELTQVVTPGTEVTISQKDAAWFAHWVDHAFNGHDDDD